MLSHDTAEFLIACNETVHYVGSIAIAVYFLAPLCDGNFSTFRERFLKYGILLLIGAALGRVKEGLDLSFQWTCRKFFEIPAVRSRLPGEEDLDPMWFYELLPEIAKTWGTMGLVAIAFAYYHHRHQR